MRRWGCALVALMVIGVLAIAWYFRDDILQRTTGTAPVDVSPEAADAAEEKLLRLLEEREETRLSEVEISSLLRYRGTGFIGAAVREPSIHLDGDTVRITGTVSSDSLPSHPEINAIRAFLPDEAPVLVMGRVSSVEAGRATFEVTSIEFAGIPIPERYHQEILQRVGRVDEPGLGPDAIAIRLPPGVGSVRVVDGYLILTP